MQKEREERKKIERVVFLTFYRSCTRSARKFDELVPRSLFLSLRQRREGQIRIDGPAVGCPYYRAEIEITHFPDKSWENSPRARRIDPLDPRCNHVFFSFLPLLNIPPKINYSYPIRRSNERTMTRIIDRIYKNNTAIKEMETTVRRFKAGITSRWYTAAINS